MQLHAIRRSCQLVLRRPEQACIYAAASRRAFCTTGVRFRGALPVFVEASKPELTSLLSTLNAKILLPQHLTKEQEKLVYRQENKTKLEAEPVEITLGDITLPLQHLKRADRPQRWDTISRIVKSSETREDWENVLRMLEGLENAGIKINTKKQGMVVRLLNLHGQHHLILKALQRAQATGLRMRSWDVVVQVFRAVYDKAALADWNKEETEKALRFAKQIVELLEDEEHCGGHTRGGSVAEHDFRGHPTIVAVPTGLTAVMALRHGGDVEEVKTLAGRLIAALEQDDYLKSLQASPNQFALTESDFKKTLLQVQHTAGIRQQALMLVWVSNALTTSLKVLGNDMPQLEQARQYQSSVTSLLDEACNALKRLRIRDGEPIMHDMVDYVFEAVEKTRKLA